MLSFRYEIYSYGTSNDSLQHCSVLGECTWLRLLERKFKDKRNLGYDSWFLWNNHSCIISKLRLTKLRFKIIWVHTSDDFESRLCSDWSLYKENAGNSLLSCITALLYFCILQYFIYYFNRGSYYRSGHKNYQCLFMEIIRTDAHSKFFEYLWSDIQHYSFTKRKIWIYLIGRLYWCSICFLRRCTSFRI